MKKADMIIRYYALRKTYDLKIIIKYDFNVDTCIVIMYSYTDSETHLPAER